MELLTTPQVARRLGVADSRARRLILEKRIPARKYGNGWLVMEDDLEEFIKTYSSKRGRPRKQAK